MQLQNLKQKLCTAIQKNDGLTVEDFFSPWLQYYYNRQAASPSTPATQNTIFGAGGDFITSPEISPLLGAVLILRLASQMANNAPGKDKPANKKTYHLLEIGAGRGTMMLDMLNHCPSSILSQLKISIVEQSDHLTMEQKKRLSKYDSMIGWHKTITALPDASVDFIVANEFFDCLLPRQFSWQENKWHERMVMVKEGAAGDKFFFAWRQMRDSAPPNNLRHHQPPKPGVIYEWHQSYAQPLTDMARVLKNNGLAIIIDYGNEGIYDGDNLQAMRHHQPVDVFAYLGEADISASVAFDEVADMARQHNMKKIYFDNQRNFLQSLHGEEVANKLITLGYDKKNIIAGYQRLIKTEKPTDMGRLFKIMELQKTS